MHLKAGPHALDFPDSRADVGCVLSLKDLQLVGRDDQNCMWQVGFMEVPLSGLQGTPGIGPLPCAVVTLSLK